MLRWPCFRAEVYYLVKASRQLRQDVDRSSDLDFEFVLVLKQMSSSKFTFKLPSVLKSKKAGDNHLWNFPASWPFQLASPFLGAAIIRAIYFAFTSLCKHYIIHSFLCLLNSATCTKFNKALPSVSPVRIPDHILSLIEAQLNS